MLLVISLLVLLSVSVSAHDLWVTGKKDEVFKADMIYGHNFPQPEVIAQERTVLFEPIQVMGKNYQETLTQKGENYHYEAKAPFNKGTYIVKASYKPTAWIKKADGKWEMKKTRKDTAEQVEYCGVSTMTGKAIVIVGDDDGSFATMPWGKGLEITPLVNAGDIKKGALVKFKLTQDGKPVKQAQIYGSFGGFATNDMSVPFYAITDLTGVFEFKALKKGLWYLKTTVDTDSGDPDCETINNKASITFEVR